MSALDELLVVVAIGLAAVALLSGLGRSQGGVQRIVQVEPVGETQQTTTSPSPSPDAMQQALDSFNSSVSGDAIESNLEGQYGDLGEII